MRVQLPALWMDKGGPSIQVSNRDWGCSGMAQRPPGGNRWGSAAGLHMQSWHMQQSWDPALHGAGNPRAVTCEDNAEDATELAA